MIRDAAPPNDQIDPRRGLPSVNALLELKGMRALLERATRGIVAGAVRAALETARAQHA